MSDEIEKVQKQAIDLGIHKFVQNIATNGANTSQPAEGEWQTCKLMFRVHERGNLAKSIISITMPTGLVLYRAEENDVGGLTITDFRYGSWVEQIAIYSDQITTEKKKADAKKAEQEKREKLAPFATISDEEFNKAIMSSRY